MTSQMTSHVALVLHDGLVWLVKTLVDAIANVLNGEVEEAGFIRVNVVTRTLDNLHRKHNQSEGDPREQTVLARARKVTYANTTQAKVAWHTQKTKHPKEEEGLQSFSNWGRNNDRNSWQEGHQCRWKFRWKDATRKIKFNWNVPSVSNGT